MKIATFNVNGVKTRLAHLLRWLEREQPDVACLQELKALDEAFPARELEAAGYHALWKGQRSWNGVAILARGVQPVEVRRSLPGDDADDQSRYLEAAVDGVIVGCLYLPNGNPQPGPKFAYKLAWFERLIAHAQTLVDALRHLHPEEPIYTFWDYFRQHWQRNAGLRIDHLLLNRQLAQALRSAGVDTWVRGEEKASDHAPTWVQLDLSASAPKKRRKAV
jgi:exodeoxyribonuclease-3